uniref:Uncharacterized protein n=1 Tax=Romanomermis culicivorax TaxID=13658 RepID=A0A915HJZ3_ROMCU
MKNAALRKAFEIVDTLSLMSDLKENLLLMTDRRHAKKLRPKLKCLTFDFHVESTPEATMGEIRSQCSSTNSDVKIDDAMSIKKFKETPEDDLFHSTMVTFSFDQGTKTAKRNVALTGGAK